MARLGAVGARILIYSSLANAQRDHFRGGAFAFKAPGAEAFEFLHGSIGAFSANGHHMADVRPAHGTLPSPVQFELQFRIALD